MANCRNCGGPLPGTLTNGTFVCDFCSTVSQPTRIGEDLIDLGRETGMDCPVCATGLTAGLIEGEPVAWCAGCQGILFPDQAFASAVRIRRSRYGAYGEFPRPLNTAACARTLACCRCQRPMQVHPFHGPGNVVIDSCYPCRLIWVDAGELSQIERAPGRR